MKVRKNSKKNGSSMSRPLRTSTPVTTSFLFKIYVYIRLNVNELGIFEGVTSHSHMITNINSAASTYLAHSSTDLLRLTCKIALKK